MKKIASLLVISILSLLLFTACGQVQSAVRSDTTEQEEAPAVEQRTVLAVTEEGIAVEEEADNASLIPSMDGLEIVFFPKQHVEFGYYPQSVAEKKAVKAMSVTTDATGYYVSSYDNEHYAKITIANVYGDKYEFLNEKTINNRETYYFKVEPIKWRVFGQVSVSSGDLVRVFLVSDCILDSSSYLAESAYYENPSDMIYYNRSVNARATDWIYSSVRKWLNGDFYRAAFSKTERERLNERVAGTSTNDKGEQVTETDKVFLLTLNQANAFEGKFAVVSDYARCRGTWMSIYPDFYGLGRWWTMTEGNTSYRVCYGGTDNKVKVSDAGESIGATYMGVRPVISIDVENLASLLIDDEEEEE